MAAGFDDLTTGMQTSSEAGALAGWRDVLAGAPALLALVEGPTAADREPVTPLAVALATIDLERAADALAAFRFAPAADDEALGARALLAPLRDGSRLVLLEPMREGRLAAFLARHGEGVAALYVAVAPDDAGPQAEASAEPDTGSPAAVLGGPCGPARLRLPAPRWGPFVLEVLGPRDRSLAR